jgi:PKD repeat protein
MRFVERVLRACGACIPVTAIGLLASLGACADGLAPLSLAPVPDSLAVVAVRPGAVRLTWAQVKGVEVRQYIVERRVNFQGAFVEVVRINETNQGQLSWLDTDVQPETVYGYRVFSLTLLGEKSPPSVTGGALTPPRPGIDISTSSSSTVAEALDPDGYELTIIGPDTVRALIGLDAKRRFAPLKTGRYLVSLGGVIDRCSVTGAVARTLFVTDTSAETITPVSFNVICRDPNRGDIAASVAVSGANLDNVFSLDVLGESTDTTLPASERVYSATRVVSAGGVPSTFQNLRPGTYTVTLRDIAANCSLSGSPQRAVTVTRLAVATVNYVIVCAGANAPPVVSTAPFVWRNRFTPKTGATGATVELEHTLDMTARAGQGVNVVQGIVTYDPAVLRFEEDTPGQLPTFVINKSTAGVLRYTALRTGPPRTGVVLLATFRFTVTGATGSRAPTLTTAEVTSASVTGPFIDSVRVVEDTFTVSAAGAVNQPPVARAGGPYTGVAGAAVSFNGAASSDSDGTIASYAWAFGDNTTGVGASPSKTYSAAGTYTATLTVTDNRGESANATASVTVSAGGTPPPSNAPIARANGPYSGQVGVPLTLSSAGSTNGTSYSWTLGNGQTASGASPSVTYAAAGSYTVVLTVSSASGATSTSQATATITAAPPPPPPPPPSNATPLVWRSLFQAYDVVNNSVALQIVYDLNTNIPETPGPEALRSFVVDSLKWDATRLQFLSLNYGPGMVNVATNQPGTSAGRLTLSASTTPGLDRGNLVIATIRFRPVGVAGRAVTTITFLGPLLGTTATNSFSYNSKTSIVEGQFTVP